MTRLDRFLVNSAWAELFPLASVRLLPKLSSDHVTLIWESENRIGGRSYFKFEMSGLMEKLVNELVRGACNRNEVSGYCSYVVSKKVQGVKTELVEWRKWSRCHYKVKIGHGQISLESLPLRMLWKGMG
ncbi:hypothetical protein AMTRI_Chr03g145390 [Amborella trichopoda]